MDAAAAAVRPGGSRPRRITVAGVAGAGKTTLARQIAAIMNVPHTEVDALHHGAAWQPRASFMSDVEWVISTDAWVIEWQYTAARPAIAARAELLVWLDLPYWRSTFPRVVRRTVRRSLWREALWNGNVEPPLYTMFRDRDHIIRWSVRTRHNLDLLDERLAIDFPHLAIVRLRSDAELDAWLAALRDAMSAE